MPSAAPPKSILALGWKELRVGRAVVVVPDRAVPRWTTNPERLLVAVDGIVRAYDDHGQEVEATEEERTLLLQPDVAPFSPWSSHRSIVPAVHDDER